MGGKTGTAENPHGEDHSVFAGIAPLDHPEIAICVFCRKLRVWICLGSANSKFNDRVIFVDSISDKRKWLEKKC